MTRPRKKSRRKRDSNPGSSALEVDALTTRPTRRCCCVRYHSEWDGFCTVWFFFFFFSLSFFFFWTMLPLCFFLHHRPPRWPSGKASASRAEDPGFESRLRRDFFGVESYQWLKNWHSSGYPARRLACQYTVTGWSRTFDLQFLSQCGST